MSSTENLSVSWQEIGEQKRGERDRKIPAEWRLSEAQLSKDANVTGTPVSCGVLTTEEVNITSDYDAVDLVGFMKEGKYTVEAVVTAFCKRAAIAHQLVNCLTEIFFDKAIARARYLDEQRKAHPEAELGPFFGLPISLKDAFNIAGFDSTMGFIACANKPATQSAALVTMLEDLGAVLYCKTNVPQTMMTADSENNVWGRTLNPHNTSLTAGGSTGGEGALIALRGSILGIGSDTAGSIRIPALCCGIYGFRPSSHIVPPTGNSLPDAPGLPYISASAGPMATSARAIRYFMESLMKAEPWRYDPESYAIPWVGKGISSPPGRAKLRVGVAWDDGVFTPTPPIRRALRDAVEKLTKDDVAIIPLELPLVAEMVSNIVSNLAMDGGSFYVSVMAKAGEPPVPSAANIGFIGPPPTLHLDDHAKFNQLRTYHKQIYHELFKQHGLDAIIMPVAPHTTVPFNTWRVGNYTAIWNYLDYPAVAIPVGKVQREDAKDNAFKYGEADKAVYSFYTGPEDYKDAPTAIQVVGQSQRDEQLINLAEYIDDMIKAHGN